MADSPTAWKPIQPRSPQGGLSQGFTLGEWHVRPSIHQLRRGDTETRLEPQLMRLLVLLAARAPEPVTKDEVIAEVWNGRMVTDDAVTQAVSKLRRALGDDRRCPRYIETVWKRGYRCVAPVSADDSAPARSWFGDWRAWTAAVVGIAAGIALWTERQSSPATPGYSIEDAVFLTSAPGRERDPALSPDGTRVAYSRIDDATGSSDIFVTPVSGAGTLQLTTGPDEERSPAWSPDGTEVAFLRHGGDGCRILAIPSIGGSARELAADCAGNGFPDLTWSRDGRWLALGGRVSSELPFAIVIIDVETGERQIVSRPEPGTWGDYDPAISPDGRHVAFIRAYSEAAQDLFVIDRAGTLERPITHDRRNLFGLTWLPAGDAILAASSRHGSYDLWRFPLHGEPERVLGGISTPINPSLDGSGENLAFEARVVDVNLWTVPVSGHGKPVASIRSTRWDIHPAIAPDGTRIAFVSDRSGAFEVWTASESGDDPRQLTRLNADYVGPVRWSADARKLAFSARAGGESDLHVYDFDEQLTRRVTRGPPEELNPTWTRDGAGLLYAQRGSRGWSVHRLNLDDGARAPVLDDAFLAVETNLPATLLLTRLGTAGLWRRSPEGEVLLLPELAAGDWASWQLSDGGIYFIDRSRERIGVTFYRFADGRRERLFDIDGPVPRGDRALAVHPDGTRALIGLIDRMESDLVLLRRTDHSPSTP